MDSLRASGSLVERPSLAGLPGLMTLGLGPRASTRRAGGGFSYSLTRDNGVVAIDKTTTLGSPKARSPLAASVTEVLRSRKAGETLGAAATGGGAAGGSRTATRFEVTVPDHVRLSGQKLTFRAYFNESVVESPLEKARARVCIFTYYLEDDTVEIHEERKKNDGMPGAKFLKRMQHPAATLDTLRIGNAVTLYGKTFKVFECDEFTRTYFADVGLPQPPNEEEPHDAFTESLRAKATDGDWHGKKQNPMKRYMEALRGSSTRKVDSLAKFLALSDVNLRFYALWDDTKGKMFGEKHRLCITYYLATDEVQIDRLRSARPIPGLSQLLKRSRLPRALIHHDDRPRSCEDGTGSEDYMKVDDFRVGETVNVYNREMLIYDCDETAQAWFLENRGIDQKAGAVDVSEPTKASPRLPPPPPTGYGTEEDSLMSWKHLVLRPPRKDLTRIRDATSKTLKFHAHLISDDPVDAGRVFRICWYMDDETISVYETKSRNSGITAGKWQARERLVNAATGKYFVASDFFVGAEVLIKSHRFNIDSADDFSLAHMEGATHLWPMSSVEFAIANLKNKLREKSASLRKMFRKFDTDKSQTISFDEFRSMLDYYGMTMPKAEVLTLFRAFDPDGGGNISYEEFMAAFTDFDDEGGAGADVTHVKAVSSEDMEAYMKHVDAVAKLEGEDQYIDVLLAKLARQFKNSKHASLVHEKFREFDKNKDHTVDRGEFFAVMGPGGMNITPRDVLLLERRFFKPEDESINYETFMSVVHSYADKTMVRSS